MLSSRRFGTGVFCVWNGVALMKELISPELSEKLVTLVALVLTLVGGGLGWRAIGPRGLVAALCGPLVLLLWRAHVYVTRFDPATGRLGLDQVSTLAGEVVMFVALGAALGWVWGRLSAFATKRPEERNRHNG